ncbi:hypothetical protein P9112_000154 [Eukaryota sp. TZLM1-RC]
MSNPRRSSIRIGSPLGGFNDTSETGRTDPPTSHLSSSSSRTPQSGTEQPLTTWSEGSNASPPAASTPPLETPSRLPVQQVLPPKLLSWEQNHPLLAREVILSPTLRVKVPLHLRMFY